MTRVGGTQRFAWIAWLALTLAVVITGDFVEDLVFEPTGVSDTSGTSPQAEDPDEHLLMPSQTDLTSFHVLSDIHLIVYVHRPPPQGVRAPTASLIEFNTHPPPCFLLPLRI
jgi:hypothetical protein